MICVSNHEFGEAKAITIIAALELGRHRRDEQVALVHVLNSSKRVYEYLELICRVFRMKNFGYCT